MTYVIPFADPLAAQTSLVGGKARNLHVLTQAGFPVPPGFVVTAAAYDAFIAQLKGLAEVVTRFDYDDPDRLRAQCETLRACLVTLTLPPGVVKDLSEALAQSGQGEAGTFAVRSSSTFEDLAAAAFAGQHDTFLNVGGVNAIIERVRDCFVSLWGDRAVLYRHQQGFSQLDAQMAVVVQEQIACDIAGVGFSMHPITGRLDQLVIDANYGLGESVVAGECEVDHFEVDRGTLKVVNQSIGDKCQMHIAAATGAEEAVVPVELRSLPCVDENQIRSIATLIGDVQDHYGWPQDIEWGVKEGSLFLFQSRPITMFPARWTRDESAERFPNPVSPLCWDFMSEVFNQSLAHSLNLMGLPGLQGEWFAWFDNYVYGNQTAVELIASVRPLKARTPADLIEEIPRLREQYGWVVDLPSAWGRDLDRFLIEIGRLSAVTFDDASEVEIWESMNDLMQVAADYFRPNIAISMTQAFLHRLLHMLVEMVVGPEQSLQTLDGLLSGIETKTSLVNAELHELALAARRTPVLCEQLCQQGGQAFWEKRVHDDYPEFASRFAKLLNDHGHREIDIDYREPTWAAQPAVVLESIALVLQGDPNLSPAQVARQQRLRFADTELMFLGSLPEELRFFFRELIRLTRGYTSLDDFEHYQTTRINPVARRAAMALGQRLSARGVLSDPDDIFFASKRDLEMLIASDCSQGVDAFQQAVAQARQSYENAWQRTPSWVLEENSDDEVDPDALSGLPGSPGVATGSCYVVHSPADFSRFPKDAILVARTTNPTWTPLFYCACGLITESGGPLSHGAVTARDASPGGNVCPRRHEGVDQRTDGACRRQSRHRHHRLTIAACRLLNRVRTFGDGTFAPAKKGATRSATPRRARAPRSC